MRISSDPDDRGFHVSFGACRIFLAGAERSNCILADEEARYALTIKLDEWGMPVKGKDGKAVLDKFYGPVRVECADWLRAAQDATGDEDEGALGAAIRALIQTP